MDDDRPPEQRGTYLGIFLTGLLAAAALVALFAACGGLTVGMAAVVAGVILLGLVHYLVWGRSLSNEVAGEREEEATRDLMETYQDSQADEPPDH
jgi:hypothetical protein